MKHMSEDFQSIQSPKHVSTRNLDLLKKKREILILNEEYVVIKVEALGEWMRYESVPWVTRAQCLCLAFPFENLEISLYYHTIGSIGKLTAVL